MAVRKTPGMGVPKKRLEAAALRKLPRIEESGTPCGNVVSETPYDTAVAGTFTARV